MIFDSSSMTNNHHLFRYKALERISQFALPYEDFTMALFKLEFDANLVYEFLMREELGKMVKTELAHSCPVTHTRCAVSFVILIFN